MTFESILILAMMLIVCKEIWSLIRMIKRAMHRPVLFPRPDTQLQEEKKCGVLGKRLYQDNTYWIIKEKNLLYPGYEEDLQDENFETA